MNAQTAAKLTPADYAETFTGIASGINAHALASAFMVLAKTVERRRTIAVLQGVQVELRSEGAARFTVSDIDQWHAVDVRCNVAQPGRFVLPFAALSAFVKGAKGTKKAPGSIDIRTQLDGKVKLSAATGATVQLQPIEEIEDGPHTKLPFPATPSQSETATSHILQANELLGALDKLAFAMSSEETRYYLNGVCVDVNAPTTTLVATDGHRMARVEFPSLNVKGWNESLPIIPRKAVANLSAAIRRAKPEGLAFSLCPRFVSVKFHGADYATTFVSKLIDGTFPDYRRVIPSLSGTQGRFMLPADELAAVAERFAKAAGDRNRSVRLDWDGETLSFFAEHDGTITRETITPHAVSSDPLTVGFNAGYLIDIAKAAKGDRLELRTQDATSPALLLPVADNSATFVLMPLRV